MLLNTLLNRITQRRGAFTIPEMLAVIAIIVIVIGLILPSLIGGKDAVHRAKCASRQHQLHVAYVNRSSDTRYAPLVARYWTGALNQYLNDTRQVFSCPSAGALTELKFIPGVGFPELQGFSVQTSSGYRIPFDGSHPRCAVIAESETVYELKFEDWHDFDWDYVLQATRNSDNSITLCGYHPTNTVFYHEVLDESGQSVGVPKTRCSPAGPHCREPKCGTIPGQPPGDLINSHFGINGRVSMFQPGTDANKILLTEYGKIVANVVGPDAPDDWTIWRATRHAGQMNTLLRDGSVELMKPEDIDPSVSSIHDKLWLPTE